MPVGKSFQDEVSDEQLATASGEVEKKWTETWGAEEETFGLPEGGISGEIFAEKAKTSAAKIEPSLAFRLTAAPEGLARSLVKYRVIIYYEPKKGNDFESIVVAFEEELNRNRRSGSESTNGTEGGVLELSPEEFDQEFELVEAAANLSAEELLREIDLEHGEVVEHLRLSNAVVAELTPEQLRAVAARPEVTRITADKKIIQELDHSTTSVHVVDARAQGLVGDGRGVVVAVLDGEIDKNHPDLRGRVEGKRNYTQEGFGRGSKHGTHVAGIIGGSGSQYRGVAPQVTIWNYKLFPTGQSESTAESAFAFSESTEGSVAADAIEDAVKDGAKVINCSWGLGDVELDGKSVWSLAAERAAKLGVVLVKSAGNAGPGAGTLTAPADANGDVIVVGAANRGASEVTSFSSRGPTADGRPKPDLCAPGEKIMSAKDGGGYQALSGTSMAAPHVSGIVALLLARTPRLRPYDVKKLLMDTAVPMSAGDTDANTQGKGLINLLAAAQTPAPVPSPATAAVDLSVMAELEQLRRTKKFRLRVQNAGAAAMASANITLESRTAGISVANPLTKLVGDLRGGAFADAHDAPSAPSTPDDKDRFVLDISPEVTVGTCELVARIGFNDSKGQPNTLEKTFSVAIGRA